MIVINFICDEPGCHSVQSAGFEHEHETYGDLIRVMREVGWKVSGGPEMGTVELRCPAHGKREHDDPA